MRARLPVHFFLLAVASFAASMCLLPFVAPRLVESFYQPDTLALAHGLALGWTSASIMAVMYRYVPALTKRGLRFPRLANVQFSLFAVGVPAMVVHFHLGRWRGTAVAAALVAASVLLFALNMLACLWPARRRGVAEAGMLFAVLSLVAAGGLGVLLALGKSVPLLAGSPLANLAAHVHLAALGWVSVTICAVSYRMLPAFLQPAAKVPRAASFQLGALAVSAVLLGASLLGFVGGMRLWSVAAAGSLLAYPLLLVPLVRTRRLPIGWTVRHALAGIACLVLSTAFGLALVWGEAGTGLSNRLASAYGVAGLLGWITNFIVGMSHQLGPGFVIGARAAAGWPGTTTAEITCPRIRPLVFVGTNLGLAVFLGGLLGATSLLVRAGAAVFGVSGLLYAAGFGWTLSWAYRRSPPARPKRPPRIVPEGDSSAG